MGVVLNFPLWGTHPKSPSYMWFLGRTRRKMSDLSIYENIYIYWKFESINQNQFCYLYWNRCAVLEYDKPKALPHSEGRSCIAGWAPVECSSQMISTWLCPEWRICWEQSWFVLKQGFSRDDALPYPNSAEAEEDACSQLTVSVKTKKVSSRGTGRGPVLHTNLSYLIC